MKHAFVLFFAATVSLTAFAKLETWTDMEGRSMEAEFISASDKFVSFRKTDGSRYVYPLEKLSEADQARVREAAGKSTATATVAPSPASAQPVAGKLTSEIAGRLVSLKGKNLAPHNREAILGARYYAIYYSAHWCPPCRGFTPELVKAYSSLKARYPDFEVIFVSSDNDQDAMRNYMSEYKMPWPAVRFDQAKSLPALKRYSERGIPNLVFVSADGEVLSSSYVDGKYVGPRKVLRDIQNKLKG